MRLCHLVTTGLLLSSLNVAAAAAVDASFQESTQVTGGVLVTQFRNMPFIGKRFADMTAPIVTQTFLHGNQKAVVGKDSTEIIDLDKETITRIDNVSKTYSVVTFAQMRKMMASMPERLQQMQNQQPQAPQQPKTDLKTSFDVSVKNTGATRVVNGQNAQEQLVTLQVHITDANAQPTDAVNSVAFTMTTDAWISPDPPELKELQDFDVRMAKKMMAGMDMSAFANSFKRNANPGLMAMLGNKPGGTEAMEEMAKEMAKVKGTRVLEVTTMAGSGTGPGVTASQNAAAATPPPSAGDVAGQAATDTASNTAANQSGRLGGFGSSLASSALGAFHRKKATPPPQPAADTTAATDGSSQTASAVLMEMTTQKQNFSQAPVAMSNFEVPAGYKQVESPMERMAK